jgi:hypothetical protein
MKNNIYTMSIAELEAAHASNLQNIRNAEATIAEGNLDARNLKNFKRFVSRAYDINAILGTRIIKLSRAQ